MTSRISKTIGAASAAALIASMGIAPLAFGQSTQNYNGNENVDNGSGTNIERPVNGIDVGSTTAPSLTITKNIYAGSTVNTAGDDYTFSFVKTKDGDFDGTDDAGSYTDGPAIQPVTLTAIAMDGTADTTHTLTAGKQTITGTVTLPALGSGGFEHAGLYEYIVYESKTTHNSGGSEADGRNSNAGDFGYDATNSNFANENSNASDAWADSVEGYVLRIYIANVSGNLQYDGVTLERFSNDNAASESFSMVAHHERVKSDPSTGLVFDNRSSATTDLKVLNINSGSFARQDQAFTFNYRIVLTLPQGAVPPNATYLVTDTGGQTAQTGTAIAFENGTATIETALGHDDYVTISGLPIGTAYTVKEWSTKDGAPTDETELKEGINNYIGQGNYKTSAADGVDQTAGEAGQSYSVGATSTLAALSATTGQNVMTITNTLASPPSPTEFAMTYAPYIIIAVIAIGGIIVLVIANKKRRDKKNEILSRKDD